MGDDNDKGIHVSIVVSRSGGFTTMRLCRFIPCACAPMASMHCCANDSTITMSAFLGGYGATWSIGRLSLALAIIKVDQRQRSPFFSSKDEHSCSKQYLNTDNEEESIRYLWYLLQDSDYKYRQKENQ